MVLLRVLKLSLALIVVHSQMGFTQDLNLQKYETEEYIVYFDQAWKMEKGNNLVQWFIKDQFGGTQYNLVIEEGMNKLNNNIVLYSIYAMNNLPKVISDFELLEAWEGKVNNSVLISYKGITGNQPSTFLQYYLVKDDKAYILSSRFDGNVDMTKLKELSELMTYLFHIK